MPDPRDESVMKRDPLALAMFAAWCNLPADKLPEAMRAHTCPATAEAWGRVADAARSHFAARDEWANNGAVPTLAAIRATAGSDEWADSADHFFGMIGETLAARAAITPKGSCDV